jgi:hypothetical protein
VYPRAAPASFHTYFTYAGTGVLAKVEDGSSWVDTDAEITANATLGSTDEDAYFEVYVNTTNLGWGWPQMVTTTTGEIKNYEAVVIMASNLTALDSSDLTAEGWKQINDNTLTTEKAFYKKLGPYYTTKGSKVDFKVKIPLDTSAVVASSVGLFKLWVLDFQLEQNVAIGSVTTAIPTVYGFLGEYGPDAAIYASAFSTSSGASTGRVLQSYLTCPS